jgi:hypothetical protein
MKILLKQRQYRVMSGDKVWENLAQTVAIPGDELG